MAKNDGLNSTCHIAFPKALYDQLIKHLFPGDDDEHGAVIAAGIAEGEGGEIKLLVREVFPAVDGIDYLPSSKGYRALQATFIHRHIIHCRDQKLVYLAVHNHGGRDFVSFSRVDIASHERGYPALLDIVGGLPVGAMVFAENAAEVDLWLPNKGRLSLDYADVIGNRLVRLRPRIERIGSRDPNTLYDRQLLIFGVAGQELLKRARIGIIGLGGIGSLVCEYAARLGVGSLILCDPDTLEASNFSRVVGANLSDIGKLKIDIAERVARQANPEINVHKLADDFARKSIATSFLECDYIFLAADSMRSRLVFNAIVHQYFIPGVQLGSKILVGKKENGLEGAYSVVRHVVPGVGCLLCNQLIDANKLATEWKSDAERKDQQYGTSTPNPSVITLNAVAASHAINDFLFYFLGIGELQNPPYRRFDHLSGRAIYEEPRRDERCSECSTAPGSRFGRGDAVHLPCSE